MKIIFLDIDGVMNDEMTFKSWHDNPNKENCPDPDLPTDEHMLQLKTIIEKTGANVVLSSSWRCSNHGIRTILERFFEYGITLYSITQEGVKQSQITGCNVLPSHMYSPSWSDESIITDRGAEIFSWLRGHPEVDKFVILDDESGDIAPYFSKNLFQNPRHH